MTEAPRPRHDVGGHDWDRLPERGSAPLVRLMIWLSLTLGWRLAHALLFPITLYFFVLSRGARRNSRIFLGRALGRPAGWRDIYRQYFAFAAVILDRVYVLADRLGPYDVRLIGLHHLTDRLADGGGCLLLGAHVGSFEILRAVAPRDGGLSIKALMHRAAVNPLTGPLERINPSLRGDIIEIGAPDAMLQVRDCLARGAVVGVLADRAPELGANRRSDRWVAVDFFGQAARFPTGPMLMAAALEAPVVLFFGVWVGPRRYEVHFEPFANPVTLGADRRGDLAAWVRRYAERLEACCRAHPYNWFNLYNFWASDAGSAVDGLGMRSVRPARRDRASRSDLHARGSDAHPGGGAGQPCDLPGGTDRRPADHAGA